MTYGGAARFDIFNTRDENYRYMGEKIRDAAGIIKILQLDFQRELEATMVYVRNAFVIKQCDPSGTTFLTATDLFANDELQMERVERY